jgi:hypothetical protein
MLRCHTLHSGIFLVINSTAPVVVAFTWNGVTYPWDHPTVLVPLILELTNSTGRITYEAYVPKYPAVRSVLLASISELIGPRARYRSRS